MLLKGSQRGTGQDLARHLMKMEDNEHVLVHEMRGFASTNLKDAFKEVEAISRGTKCRQYLFSLSLSPPETARVEVEGFEAAIGRIEEKLNLTGQPRAIVFHEKEGRRHAHCVWSRIDAETMKAIPMSFFKQKLMNVSRDLYLENGWKMPKGLDNRAERNPTNFTLAEWQQAKRNGMDPRWIKQDLQACWAGSDSLKSFERALQERGYFLAKGDRRGLVVLDFNGEVYSLPRMLNLKTKEVRARLGDGEGLKSLDATKEVIGEKMKPAIRRHIEESRTRFKEKAKGLTAQRQDMTERHRDARAALKGNQRLEWHEQTKERAARLPKGWKALWWKLTGKYQCVRALNETQAVETKERQADERQKLIDKQIQERSQLQEQIKEQRREQAKQLRELRREIGRYLGFRQRREDSSRGRFNELGLSRQQ
jgi:hypothetical protein